MEDMENTKYDMKAIEELGKVYINVGTSLFKAALLLVGITPAVLILKGIMDSSGNFETLKHFFTVDSLVIIIVFSGLVIYGGYRLTKHGLFLIRNAEAITNNNKTNTK